jgi:hypothetical protein
MILRGKVSVFVAMALAGCATTGGVPGTGASGILAKIQQYAVTYCAFEPTIATVGAIAATFGGPAAVAGEAMIEQVAKAICAAVAPMKVAEAELDLDGYDASLVILAGYQELAQAPPATPALKIQPGSKAKGIPPKVNNVVIHGKFVK